MLPRLLLSAVLAALAFGAGSAWATTIGAPDFIFTEIPEQRYVLVPGSEIIPEAGEPAELTGSFVLLPRTLGLDILDAVFIGRIDFNPFDVAQLSFQGGGFHLEGDPLDSVVFPNPDLLRRLLYLEHPGMEPGSPPLARFSYVLELLELERADDFVRLWELGLSTVREELPPDVSIRDFEQFPDLVELEAVLSEAVVRIETSPDEVNSVLEYSRSLARLSFSGVPIPEPTSVALLLPALLVLIGWGIVRRRSSLGRRNRSSIRGRKVEDPCLAGERWRNPALLMVWIPWALSSCHSLTAASLPQPLSQPQTRGATHLLQTRVTIQWPPDHGQAEDLGEKVFVTGKAAALPAGGSGKLDLVLVVDTSESTDRKLPVNPTSGVSGRISILQAEIRGIGRLLGRLDPHTTRVSLVEFSGDYSSLTPDAAVRVPLTGAYKEIEAELRAMTEHAPDGMTNIVAGLETALYQLVDAESDRASVELEPPNRMILLMTDGLPNLPFPSHQTLSLRATVKLAKRLRKAAIVIHPVGIRVEPHTLDFLEELSVITRGTFAATAYIDELVELMSTFDLSGISEINVRNRTTKGAALRVTRDADGTFSALVPAIGGANTIEVLAASVNGAEATATVTIDFQPGAIGRPVPAVFFERQRAILVEPVAP